MSALKLAQSLIRIKSISPNDGGCFDIIEKELQKGAEKAKVIANGVLQRVRQKIGY